MSRESIILRNYLVGLLKAYKHEIMPQIVLINGILFIYINLFNFFFTQITRINRSSSDFLVSSSDL